MDRVLVFVRIYAAVMGSAFLGGQIFFASFSVLSTIIGLAGIASAALSSPLRARGLRNLAVVLCVAGIMGVAIDAVEYYVARATPGDSYPWVLTGLFVAAMAFLVFSNLVVGPRSVDGH